jgi:hypothetical protein
MVGLSQDLPKWVLEGRSNAWIAQNIQKRLNHLFHPKREEHVIWEEKSKITDNPSWTKVDEEGLACDNAACSFPAVYANKKMNVNLCIGCYEKR